MRVIDVLQEQHPNSSQRTLKQWLKEGRVTLNGRTIYKATADTRGGMVSLGTKKPQEKSWKGMKILFEDKDCIVIDKPKQLLSVPQDIPGEASALRYLRQYTGSRMVYPAHRLDRETSGVLLFAKNKPAHEKLRELFHNRDLTRIYFAVCLGKPKEPKGTFTSYLSEDASGHVHSSSSPEEGRIAITHYEVIQERKKTSLLRFELETGRKHQIRVHCSQAGIPILGDVRYGAPKSKRLFLHAHTLRFIHPTTRKRMEFISEMPRIFCSQAI